MRNKGLPGAQKVYQAVLWIALACFLAVCTFFQIHNAQWLLGDEAIVMNATGMDKAFSPLGFSGMITSYGRFYPFAYNLYNVLLPFYDGRIPPSAIYTLQAVALVIFACAFALSGLILLRKVSSPWKYATVFFFVVICVFRVYPEFITCYTGVWIVYLFLSLFLLFSCRFCETENWVDGILALVSINYVIYCYETVFTIPMAVGACSLLFNYRGLTRRKRVFHGLLVASGLLFLALYAVLVVPNARDYYQHYGTSTFIGNALKMFLANKLYWLATVVLAVRVYQKVVKKSGYRFQDSLLLASFAYFLGAAVLKLNYTYYYNIGALIGLAACVSLLSDWLKPQWICLLMLAFALFYGRKIPGVIRKNQAARSRVYQAMTALSRQVDSGETLYWFEPPYEGTSPSYLDMRETSKVRVKVYLDWLRQAPVSIEGQASFDGKKGVWLVYPGSGEDIPGTPADLQACELVFSTTGIKGYRCP